MQRVAGKLVLLVSFYTALIGFALYSFYWCPTPLAADAQTAVFAEARARHHVAVLTSDIGPRSVSTAGLQAAHHYIWDLTQKLQAAGEQRGDIIVQTAFENYTGSNDFDFVGERFINAYHNISNIILHISRKGVDHLPAVLLVAHHDSPVASPGAGDDASNVGVMLELAHNLLATPAEQLPPVPVMFLFSGAEEPLCQSAAAFMALSPWASRAGVFINLESIGPGGSPIVFQHAGAWTIEAFARGAVHPRGASAAQDMFDAGLVLGDTDYRQLSYRDRGRLPGIDIAYLLSGAAYHTQTDTLDRIRPGVLQETGESMTAAIKSLAAALADAAAVPEAPANTAGGASEQEQQQQQQQQQPRTLKHLLEPSDHRRMFVSAGGAVMITYSSSLARLLHNMPLVLVLTAPHTLQLLSPATALPPSEGLRVVFASAGRTLVTLLLALGVPAAFGVVRAALSGTAMVWFANPALGFAMYFPVAAAMLLLPWSHVDYSEGKDLKLLPYHILGAALFNSAVAVALTQLGAGTAMVFAMWGAAGVLVAFCLSQGVSYASMIGALVSATWPIYTCCETALVLSIVMMSRMSLTGHVFIGMGDAIVGLLLGLGALSITGGTALPLAQALLGRRTSRRLAGAFMAAGVLVAVGCSVGGVFPYSATMPKRLMLARLHYVQGEGGTSAPAVRIANSSWVLAGADSNPVGWFVPALGLDAKQAVAPTGDELMLVFPVSKLLDVLKFPDGPGAPPPQHDPDHIPYVKLLHKPARGAGGDILLDAQYDDDAPPGSTRVHLEVVAPQPCWGTLKLVGQGGRSITGWSIQEGHWRDAGSFLAKQHSGSGSVMVGSRAHSSGSVGAGNDTVSSLVVKFTNEHQQAALRWRIAVTLRDADSGDPKQQQQQQQQQLDDAAVGLRVELHVGYINETPELAAVEQRMPAWSTLSYRATIFVGHWHY